MKKKIFFSVAVLVCLSSWLEKGHAQGEAHFYNTAYVDPSPSIATAVKVGDKGLAVNGNSYFMNGNLGVGTLSPSNKLTVNGDGRFEQGVYAASVGFRLTASSTDLVNASTWYGLGRSSLILPSGTPNATSVQVAGFFGLNLKTAKGDMAMLSNGNVGIGTLTPTAKLAVNGTVKAQEVNVTVNGSDWPDYVFSGGYRLPSLDSLSSRIAELGHLPGMPSAQEVGEDGVNLGEMNRKLLEKVEELTLLLIEQGKRVERQGKEIAELKKAVSAAK